MARKAETLDLAVLGLLHESPLHGYELRKRLNLLLGWRRLLSYGSLYPALKKLLRAGLIHDQEVDGVGRRQRIVYEITDAGRAHFGLQVTDAGPSSWDDEAFDIRFAFFSRTDAPIRLRILEGRRARLEERLDRVRGSAASTYADSYVNELRRHGIESVERELAWLAGLIEIERRSGVDPQRTEEIPPADRSTSHVGPAELAGPPPGGTET